MIVSGDGTGARLVDAARRAGVRDARVLEAIRTVPRKRFVPTRWAALASADEPVPIGHGEVYSIERLADLATQARENLSAAGVDNVVVILGDGMLGLPSHAPFQAVIVAAALPFVPPALVEQLAEDGRLVQPIGPGGDEIVAKFRKCDGKLVRAGEVGGAGFVPLIAGVERPT